MVCRNTDKNYLTPNYHVYMEKHDMLVLFEINEK